MSKKTDPPSTPLRNPVAKHAGKFNRAATFRDRRAYTRKDKHKGREPFPIRAA
jgi:hypothetical protein